MIVLNQNLVPVRIFQSTCLNSVLGFQNQQLISRR